MPSNGVKLTRDAARRTGEAVRWVERQVRDMTSESRARPGTSSNGFWARITAHELAGDPDQPMWKYTARQQVKVAAGYRGWQSAPNSVNLFDCYNTMEDTNWVGAGGRAGNGVYIGGLCTQSWNFEILPCPNDAIVWMRRVVFKVGSNSITEYWFTYENGVDGDCSECPDA